MGASTGWVSQQEGQDDLLPLKRGVLGREECPDHTS